MSIENLQTKGDLSRFIHRVLGVDPVLAGKAPAVHTHPESDIVGLVADLAGKVSTGDPRLSDARTPLDASVTDAKIATTLSPSKITGTAVVTADARLSDTRTPSASSITDAMIATTLSPGKITGTAVVTADSRLSDARTPTAHAASHAAAGSDALSGITDTQLASPNSSVFHRLASVVGQIGSAATAATRILGAGTGGIITSGAASSVSFPLFVPIFAADFSVSGKTAKLRVRAALSANAVTPTGNYTVGLYPVSSVGGASASGNSTTVGTVVASTTVLFSGPTASTLASGVSSEVSLPSDGWYVLGVVSSGTVATGSSVVIAAHLDLHFV